MFRTEQQQLGMVTGLLGPRTVPDFRGPPSLATTRHIQLAPDDFGSISQTVRSPRLFDRRFL